MSWTIPRRRGNGFWIVALVGGLALLPAWLGCNDAGVSQPTSLADREFWEVYSIEGVRVGYGRTAVRYPVESGATIVEIQHREHLAVKRFGQETKQDVHFISREHADGKLINFASDVSMGSALVRTAGRVVGKRLDMETASKGKKTANSIPWDDDNGGFYAMEQSLSRRPMQPMQHRAMQTLVPGFNQVATLELTARDIETVRLLDGTRDLMRIDTVLRFADGQTVTGSVWTDAMGEPLKTRADAMGLESFRTTKDMALQGSDKIEFDLGGSMTVDVNRHLDRPHQTKRVVYSIELSDRNPATVFVSGPSQQVKSTGAHTADVIVTALRPGVAAGDGRAADDPPTDADRRPNNLIQSDDAKVVELAAKAAGEEKDPWAVAVKLEKFVFGYVTKKDFSQAFATAAEVAAQPEGDCTEHAVLLAALARARGIPARVAIGLVYMDHMRKFGYHMWTEVYVDGRWTALDGTLGQGGIGAAHLQLARSSLQEASTYSAFVPVAQVVGRLKISIGAVEY